jgi:hypothetical protein
MLGNVSNNKTGVKIDSNTHMDMKENFFQNMNDSEWTRFLAMKKQQKDLESSRESIGDFKKELKDLMEDSSSLDDEYKASLLQDLHQAKKDFCLLLQQQHGDEELTRDWRSIVATCVALKVVDVMQAVKLDKINVATAPSVCFFPVPNCNVALSLSSSSNSVVPPPSSLNQVRS